MKICLVGGAGGHLRELLQISKSFDERKLDFFFVTYDTPFTRHLNRTYLIRLYGSDLPRLFITNLFNLWSAFKIIRRESPDVVITTGTEFALAYCVMAKMRKNAITIFIESLCRIKKRSGTGRIISPFVDMYLIQWETVGGEGPRKAQYWGRVI